MAQAPTNITNILGAYKKAKSSIEKAISPLGYTQKSCGTKDPLCPPFDLSTGYWQEPGQANKPKRWILHIDGTVSPPIAGIARNAAGSPLAGSAAPGYINASSADCAVAVFRIMPAVKTSNMPLSFTFPDGWEWILALTFPQSFPSGTSGELLTDFDSAAGTVKYQAATYRIASVALVKMPGPPAAIQTGAGSLSYQDATNAIKTFLGASGIPIDEYDPSSDTDLLNLQSSVASSLKPVSSAAAGPKVIQPDHGLIGISGEVYSLINAALAIGKQHFIFYGPPGTGKTTLAEHVATQLANDDEDEDEPYVLLTASSSWSGQDLVGGYQPLGPGKMGFVKGAMLKNFNKPIVIDELNRCPIDKVIGPLFSVLSGQATTLPYRVDIADADSKSYKILPKPKDPLPSDEFAPGENWAMICTLNQIDKTQLGQVSYALTRRFAWIRIGSPDSLREFVAEILDRNALLKGVKDLTLPNPVADMWEKVNAIREIGGAPIIDFIRLAAKMDDSIDFLAVPSPATQGTFLMVLGAAVLPLLDGIRRREAEDLLEGVSASWGLDAHRKGALARYVMDLAV